MSEIIRNIKSGFSWGLGFSLSVILSSSIFTVYGVKQLEDFVKENYRPQLVRKLGEYFNGFEIEVHNLYKVDNEIRIASTIYNNSGEERSGPKVLFDIFDKNEQFLANCSAKSSKLAMGIDAKEHIEAICKLSQKQALDAHHAKGRFRLL